MKLSVVSLLVVLSVVSTVAAYEFCATRSYSISYSNKAENAVRCYVLRQPGSWNCSGRKCTLSTDSSKFYTGVVESGSTKVRNWNGGQSMTTVSSMGAENFNTTDFDGQLGNCRVNYSINPITQTSNPISLTSCGKRR